MNGSLIQTSYLTLKLGVFDRYVCAFNQKRTSECHVYILVYVSLFIIYSTKYRVSDWSMMNV